MKDRIKQVRESEGLTMDSFGNRIGITRSSVSLLESGKSNPSNQTIKFICREFKINEEWLLTGEGAMHSGSALIDQLFEWVGTTLSEEDSFRVDFLTMLMQLDPEDWVLIEKMTKKLLKAQQEREAPPEG